MINYKKDKEKSLKYINGDILTPAKKSTIVCHQVNCKGVMGAGLAKQIKFKFPHVFEIYSDACRSCGSDKLGDIQLVSCLNEAGYIIANIFGQNSYGTDKRHTDYNALRSAFQKLSSMDSWTIRIPYKMGCGLGGGDWNTVLSIIHEELVDKGCAVEIWKL